MRVRSLRPAPAGALALLILAAGVEADWRRWGGPGQEFRATSSGLASTWPPEGPPRLWQRELGAGYSAILIEGERLFTMYRAGGDEIIVALDAGSGETLWEHRYAARPGEGHIGQFGEGPRATPLVAGERLYAAGITGRLTALDKSSGEVAWSRELWQELGGNFLIHGYSSSPIDYGDAVIVPVGGDGHGIVAFAKSDGALLWSSQSSANSYSTPKIVRVGDRDLLLTFMERELVALDPATGDLEWVYPYENHYRQNVGLPMLVDDVLFISSPQLGARGLRLKRDDGGKTTVEEAWASRKIQFYHVTSARDGDWVYGSTGLMAPAFMAAVNVKTGEIGWRKRGFAKANCVFADGKLIILDEDGTLYLTTATPEDLVVHSRLELLTSPAWTVPTISGRRLFVRDQTTILALDLGEPVMAATP